MEIFQGLLLLLVGAVCLTAIARRISVPYPSLLALGGVALALLPAAPKLDVDPELMLALFVAPVLLDAAYDTSVRDLRANWIPIAPRDTVPVSMIWLYEFTAMLMGIAKPTPAFAPVLVAIIVLTPITSPRMFSSGPPLLPGLMAVSV